MRNEVTLIGSNSYKAVSKETARNPESPSRKEMFQKAKAISRKAKGINNLMDRDSIFVSPEREQTWNRSSF